jgi:hypothetical protein
MHRHYLYEFFWGLIQISHIRWWVMWADEKKKWLTNKWVGHISILNGIRFCFFPLRASFDCTWARGSIFPISFIKHRHIGSWENNKGKWAAAHEKPTINNCQLSRTHSYYKLTLPLQICFEFSSIYLWLLLFTIDTAETSLLPQSGCQLFDIKDENCLSDFDVLL